MRRPGRAPSPPLQSGPVRMAVVPSGRAGLSREERFAEDLASGTRSQAACSLQVAALHVDVDGVVLRRLLRTDDPGMAHPLPAHRPARHGGTPDRRRPTAPGRQGPAEGRHRTRSPHAHAVWSRLLDEDPVTGLTVPRPWRTCSSSGDGTTAAATSSSAPRPHPRSPCRPAPTWSCPDIRRRGVPPWMRLCHRSVSLGRSGVLSGHEDLHAPRLGGGGAGRGCRGRPSSRRPRRPPRRTSSPLAAPSRSTTPPTPTRGPITAPSTSPPSCSGSGDSLLGLSSTRPRPSAVAMMVHLPDSSWTAGEGVWKSQDSVCC